MALSAKTGNTATRLAVENAIAKAESSESEGLLAVHKSEVKSLKGMIWTKTRTIQSWQIRRLSLIGRLKQ